MRTLFLFVFLLLCCGTASSQTRFERSALVADADTLLVGIGELHPDMFAAVSRQDWMKRFDRAKASLRDSMTSVDFFRIMAPVVCRLSDGHTALWFPEQEIKGMKVFPIAVKIGAEDGNICVESAPESSEGLPGKVRIRSINGHGARKIVASLSEYVSGEKEFFKREVLGYQFAGLYTLLDRDSVFDIRYSAGGKKGRVRLPGCDPDSVRAGEAGPEIGRGYSLTVMEHPRVALLALESCGVGLDDFNRFLDSCFTALRDQRIDRLVIDVRHNGGGDSRVADELFEYISPGPFTQFDRITTKISGRIKQIYKFLGDRPLGVRTSTYQPDTLKNYPNRFRGEVYLLVSNYTFSSAADLAWAFKHYKMGTIVGEESGGLGVCFGDSAPLRLPHTKVTCGVSWKKFYNVGADDDSVHGVIPDVAVPAERALDRVLEMVAAGQR